MLRRKKPKMLKKRRLMNVSACRRRVKRCFSSMKLHRRQREFFVQQDCLAPSAELAMN